MPSRRSRSSTTSSTTAAQRPPAAQATPFTHDEKVERVNARIGELRLVRYDPIGTPTDALSAEDKAARVNARIAAMAGRG